MKRLELAGMVIEADAIADLHQHQNVRKLAGYIAKLATEVERLNAKLRAVKGRKHLESQGVIE